MVKCQTALDAPCRQLTRLHRTAAYASRNLTSWCPEGSDEMMREMNFDEPVLDQSMHLREHWRRFHARAELAMQHGIRRNWVKQIHAAERSKGSAPTSRPTCSGAARRPDEPVILRRLLRSHRQLTERLRQRISLHADLASKDFRTYVNFVEASVIKPTN